VVADAVTIETVSALNSLISGKIQGISRILASDFDCDPQTKIRNQVLEHQIPYAIEQGIFCWNREENSFEQGVCIGKLLAYGGSRATSRPCVDEVANFRGLSLQFWKCREILEKCREAPRASLPKSIIFQRDG